VLEKAKFRLEFIPHLIWGRNDGKRAFLPFSQFINNENQLKEKT